MVYGVCRDAFVNSAAQIIVNLNKIAPHGLTNSRNGLHPSMVSDDPAFLAERGQI
jgi:hypothetical protein